VESQNKSSLKEHGFYISTAWRKLRVAVLQRSNYLCANCLRHKRITLATEIHHIKPLEAYPELALDINNLEALCWRCHEETKYKKSDVAGTRVRVIGMNNGDDR